MSSDLVAETLRRLAGRQLTPFDVDLLNRLENGVARAESPAAATLKDRLANAIGGNSPRSTPVASPYWVRPNESDQAIAAELSARTFQSEYMQRLPRAVPDDSSEMLARIHNLLARSQAGVEPLRQMDDDALRQVQRYMQENLPPDLPPATPSPARLRPERTPPARVAPSEPELPTVQGNNASAERPRRRILTKRISSNEISGDRDARDGGGGGGPATDVRPG
jgi:hypothetical protein